MNKIKKIFISLGAFFAGIVSKVFAADSIIDSMNLIVDTNNLIMIDTKYGVFEPTIGEKISTVGKLALPIIIFIIGLFVILSKKITKKVKAIVVSILIILTVLGYILLNYIAIYFW